jgi:maltose alpha-D-glucosyltransferase/alpha-amylase
LSLDLSAWKGQRTREVMWGCEFPIANEEWFVNLPPYGFNWWLIGEVEVAAESRPD